MKDNLIKLGDVSTLDVCEAIKLLLLRSCSEKSQVVCEEEKKKSKSIHRNPIKKKAFESIKQ